MSRLIISTSAVLFTLMALCGCGQKGNLYLPGEKSTALESELIIA